MIFSVLFIFILFSNNIQAEFNIEGHIRYKESECSVALNSCKLRGPRGLPGYPGPNGSPGTPGKDGSCSTSCNKTYSIIVPKGTSSNYNVKFGTEENPSHGFCNVILNGRELKGKIWVNPADKFQVRCDEKTKMTCLNIETKDKNYYQTENFVDYSNKTKPFWLSDYNYGKKFDLQEFYGITMKQMAWLQKNSMQVTQKIRYHCKNSHVSAWSSSTLEMLSWNDVIIGPNPTNLTPLYYTLSEESKDNCYGYASKDEWHYTDILLRGSVNRIPVIDFHIKDTRNEAQSFSLELLELCFA